MKDAKEDAQNEDVSPPTDQAIPKTEVQEVVCGDGPLTIEVDLENDLRIGATPDWQTQHTIF